MTLAELRAAVRDQLGLDESDLPNATVDFYLRAAYEQTLSAEREWPFYEEQWTVSTTADTRTAALPTDYAIHSLVIHSEAGPLSELSHEFAMTNFWDAEDAGVPAWFSIRGGYLYLWPSLEEDAYTVTIVGYRRPAAFPTASGNEPDADERLHTPIVWNACSLAKAQEEDYEGAAKYAQDWQSTLAAARADIMRPNLLRTYRLNAGNDRLVVPWGGSVDSWPQFT